MANCQNIDAAMLDGRERQRLDWAGGGKRGMEEGELRRGLY